MTNKISSGASPISLNDGLQAAKAFIQEAKSRKIRAALCGGIAMQLYGFTRATKDVDIISGRKLSRKAIRKLNFGGEAYESIINGVKIEIDWIVRDDDQKEIYSAALEAAKVDKATNLPIISTAWMVILKYLAGRGKDQMDLLWLLRQDKLVNRNSVNKIVKTILGKHSYWAQRDLDSVYLEADLLKARDEKLE